MSLTVEALRLALASVPAPSQTEVVIQSAGGQTLVADTDEEVTGTLDADVLVVTDPDDDGGDFVITIA